MTDLEDFIATPIASHTVTPEIIAKYMVDKYFKTETIKKAIEALECNYPDMDVRIQLENESTGAFIEAERSKDRKIKIRRIPGENDDYQGSTMS